VVVDAGGQESGDDPASVQRALDELYAEASGGGSGSTEPGVPTTDPSAVGEVELVLDSGGKVKVPQSAVDAATAQISGRPTDVRVHALSDVRIEFSVTVDPDAGGPAPLEVRQVAVVSSDSGWEAQGG
jgi:hypothetical protein